MRKFEKISFRQFAKDCEIGDYNDITLPIRKTKNSAGYDFISFVDITIDPGATKMIPTGVKACMENDEYLSIIIRSSLGIKHGICLCNQVGIIDSDYYNNDSNEGHIWIALRNDSANPYNITKGSAFAQGIFSKYLTTSDDNISVLRKGGIGSTDGSDVYEK